MQEVELMRFIVVFIIVIGTVLIGGMSDTTIMAAVDPLADEERQFGEQGDRSEQRRGA